jgi:hypothetical protein
MSPTQFRHTQYAVYITAMATALAAGYDSCHTIVQKYHINKKWFYLYGIMIMFAYLYVRPLIRKRLGSASSGYINWNTVYAVWLCSAVFYHMPSFESLGFDIRADVSIMLTVFSMSCALLGTLAGTYGFLTSIRSVSKRLLYVPPSSKEIFGVVIMNSMTLALACSTYYSFCGNSLEHSKSSYPDDVVRNYICSDLLKPLSPHRHRIFSSWVIYGEHLQDNQTSITTYNNETSIQHIVVEPDEKILLKGYISPVFTTWLTMFFLFICNSSADFVAAYCVRSATSSRIGRRGMARSSSMNRSKSVETERLKKSSEDMGSFGSLARLDSLLSSSLIVVPLQKTVSSFFHPKDSGMDESKILPNVVVGRRVPENTPGPSFLPMFPWYSGTSADLLNTLFDLVVSVKVFVGRFDMRTLLATTSIDGTAVAGTQGPAEGDGYTFEHLSGKDEVWVDFCADTGDGGNSTYSIARCLAAPSICVDLPKEYAAKEEELPGTIILPRGDTLVHGGDLAYPNPTGMYHCER